MKRFQVLSHTADVRLKIFGKDYEELFQNAALGLAKILDKESEKKVKFVRGFERISVNGQNWETLLVNFLNEVLSLSNINKKVYLKVKILKLSPTDLEAQIFGLPVIKFNKDIKAVSYHGVEIRKSKQNISESTLTLDI